MYAVRINADLITSMHSSRMRTARLLPISPSMHCMVGYGCLVGVSAPGGLLPMGSALRGVYLHTLRHTYTLRQTSPL